jgi:hypothetical protein
MADINTLLGMGVSPQDNMQALAERLRGQQQTGQMLGMSTLSPVAQYGQNMATGAADSARTGGALRQAMEKENTRKLELKDEKERLQKNIQNTALAKTVAAKKIADEKAAKRTTTSYWHPTKPNTVLNLRVGSDGAHYDDVGENWNPQLLTPYKAGQQGSKQNAAVLKYQDKVAGEETEMLLGNDIISQAITSPLMTAATGKFYDIPKQLGEFTGLLPEVQSQQNLLKEISLKAAAPTLEKLGVNPTDKDLQVAFDSVPSASDEPRTWIDWYKTRYMPRMLSAIRNGSKPELEDRMREEMNDVINEAEFALKNEQDKGFLSLPQTSNEIIEQPQQVPSNDGWTIREKQ